MRKNGVVHGVIYVMSPRRKSSSQAGCIDHYGFPPPHVQETLVWRRNHPLSTVPSPSPRPFSLIGEAKFFVCGNEITTLGFFQRENAVKNQLLRQSFLISE